jgi:hypothetical protein
LERQREHSLVKSPTSQWLSVPRSFPSSLPQQVDAAEQEKPRYPGAPRSPRRRTLAATAAWIATTPLPEQQAAVNDDGSTGDALHQGAAIRPQQSTGRADSKAPRRSNSRSSRMSAEKRT